MTFFHTLFGFKCLKAKAKPCAFASFQGEIKQGESSDNSTARYPPACLRGVLVERDAAKPEPRSVRTAGPTSSLSGLHPDSQRPPSLPPHWTGGLGSAATLSSMSAEDGSNLEEMWIGRCVSERSKKSRWFIPLEMN